MAVRESLIVVALRQRTSDVSRRVRAFRTSVKMTQEELGQRARLTQKFISQVENGRANPSIQSLTQIVENGLGMPLSTFFGVDSPGDLRDDLAKLEALFAAQPAVMRRRALRVLQALCDE